MKTALVTAIATVATMLLTGAALPAAPGERTEDVYASTTITVVPRGVPQTDRTVENRRHRHSSLEPAGRFVRAGDTVTVTVSGSPTQSRLAIGAYGAYAGLNQGQSLGLKYSPLREGISLVTADRDGLVFVVNEGSTAFDVTIEGGTPVPTLRKGVTSAADFQRELTLFPESPFVSIIGDNVVGDFQRTTVEPCVDRVNQDLVEYWDKVIAVTNETYALDPAGAPPMSKSAARIYISNEDTGAGLAFATNDRISFHNKSSGGKNLFCRGFDRQWGLWHEIGHTYQTPQYLWSGMSEVTVNISALAVQESFGWPNNVDAPKYQAIVSEFRQKPVADRNFAEIASSADRLFTQLLMFDQLRRGFGDHFYPRLSLAYRKLVAEGGALPGDDAQKIQTFMRLASEIAQRNLSPFFEEWGLHPDAETREVMSTQPELKSRPWDNFNRATDVVEYAVPLRPSAVDASLSLAASGAAQAIGAEQLATGQGLQIEAVDHAAGFTTEFTPGSLTVRATDENASDTTLSVHLRDRVGLPVTSRVSVHVVPVPTAVEDSSIAYVGSPTLVDLLTNDTGEQLRLKAAASEHVPVEVVDPGSIKFAATPETPETFEVTYVIADALGQTATSRVTVDVFPEPEALPDSATTSPSTPIELRVLENDRGRGLTLVSVSQPNKGSVRIISDNALQFDPGTVEGETAKFTYVMTDPNGHRATGEISVEITPLVRPSEPSPEPPAASEPPTFGQDNAFDIHGLATTGGQFLGPAVLAGALALCAGTILLRRAKRQAACRREAP